MKKSLLTTNRYLRNTSHRKQALSRNIETSSAIEGICVRRDSDTGRFVEDNKLANNT